MNKILLESIILMILVLAGGVIFWYSKRTKRKIWNEDWYWILMIIFALVMLPLNAYLFRGKIAVDDIAFGFMIVICMFFVWYTRKTGSIMFMRLIFIGGGLGVGFFVGMGLMFSLEDYGIFDIHTINPPVLRLIPLFVTSIIFGKIFDYLGKRRDYMPFA